MEERERERVCVGCGRRWEGEGEREGEGMGERERGRESMCRFVGGDGERGQWEKRRRGGGEIGDYSSQTICPMSNVCNQLLLMFNC